MKIKSLFLALLAIILLTVAILPLRSIPAQAQEDQPSEMTIYAVKGDTNRRYVISTGPYLGPNHWLPINWGGTMAAKFAVPLSSGGYLVFNAKLVAITGLNITTDDEGNLHCGSTFRLPCPEGEPSFWYYSPGYPPLFPLLDVSGPLTYRANLPSGYALAAYSSVRYMVFQFPASNVGSPSLICDAPSDASYQECLKATRK